MRTPLTKTLRAGLLSITVAGAAACAATDCDPTQGGLVQGIRCDASGGFDARVKQRQEQQASLLDQQMQLARESQQLEAEQRDVAAQLGISVEAVKSRLHRARVNLRERVLDGSGSPA